MSDLQSFLWGQSVRVRLTTADQQATQQILQVSLPTPAVCSIYLTAAIESGDGIVVAFTANLTIGVGRTNLKRTLSFGNQPSMGVPLEHLIPHQPVTALQLDCIVDGTASAVFGEMVVLVGAELAPITSINPADKTALKFGMALPGEADGADDDAFDEIEEYDPELVEELRERQKNGQPMPSMQAIEELIAKREFIRERGPSHARRVHDQADANAQAVRKFSRFSRRRYR